ncbi:MAG TPA: hypothetical protein VN947_13240 [Polyangia bacterium]|nr:hypothetical protein [Polyangia bacterium]
MITLSRNTKIGLAIYAVFLVGYAAASGNRILHRSNNIHFSYQAQMFLHRQLDLGHPPPGTDDWAEVEYLHLKDGRTVAGAFLRSQPTYFHALGGGKPERITADQIQNRWKKYYVSFPPFPALLFLPFVAIFGLAFNDVLFTVILAALAPMLLFFVLRRLSARGDSTRSEEDDLWLVGMFGFGTVFFYSSVIGQVWYTAHVVATVLTGLCVLASLEARRPILAGLCVGALLLTRPHIASWALFFFYEAWRAYGRKVPIKKIVAFGVPIILLGGLGFAFNWARFGAFGEFGHFYLNVRWTDRIQRYGLTNFSFLARNLSCALTLTPKLIAKPPYFQLSWHGMSLLITTPAYLYLLWPRVKSSLHTALWCVIAPIALAGFLYQNDGWVQFGYRFSNDFSFALIMLLAIGGRPLTRTWKALILVGVAVNVFGAVTFGRFWQYYYDGFFPISQNEL